MQKNSQHISQLEEQAYEQVAIELADNIRKEGLWAKALSVCEGDEAKCKALYINYRATQILDELRLHSTPIQSQSVSSMPATNQKTILYSVIGVALFGLLGFLLFFNSSQELIDARYLVNNDGTVTDIQTNLTWQRCSVGQTWTGETCAGEIDGFIWMDAQALVRDGWRLPTVEELDTLVECPKGRKPSVRQDGRYDFVTDGECHGSKNDIPKINIHAFPNTPLAGFWSSSQDARNAEGAWSVGTNDGMVSLGHKEFRFGVRLVRTVQ